MFTTIDVLLQVGSMQHLLISTKAKIRLKLIEMLFIFKVFVQKTNKLDTVEFWPDGGTLGKEWDHQNQ